MDIAMALPPMLPHGRLELLAWCRGIDQGRWSSLAVPERVTFPSHAVTVQLSAAAALREAMDAARGAGLRRVLPRADHQRPSRARPHS